MFLTWLELKAREIHEKYLEEHRQNEASSKNVQHAMTVIGVLGPFSTSVQAFHIFATKVVSGIAPMSWMGYTFVTICWMAYGFFNKDKPVIIVNTLSLIMNLSILTGYFLFS